MLRKHISTDLFKCRPDLLHHVCDEVLPLPTVAAPVLPKVPHTTAVALHVHTEWPTNERYWLNHGRRLRHLSNITARGKDRKIDR